MKKKVFVGDIKSIDEKEMTLTASISTDTVDRMGEVLDPGGIELGNYRKNPVVLWAHDYSQPPIGKAMWVRRDGNSIISKVQFAKTAFAQEIFQLYKDGIMKAFSVGFVPKDGREGDGKKGPRYTYTKWELLEYSAVPVPANPDAIALAISKGMSKETMNLAFREEQEEGWDESSEAEEEQKEVKFDGLEELEAENILLKEQNEALEKECRELKVKLFGLLTTKKQKLSEITDQDLLRKAEEVLIGVIRKAQGKVS